MSFVPVTTLVRCGSARLALVLVLMWPAVLGAQDRSTDRAGAAAMPADITAAHVFLLAAYPDLIGRPLEIQARQDGAGVVASVTDLSVPRVSGVAAPLVTARFEFDVDARLRRYDAYGPLLEEARNLALQDELLAHPRWIDSDADVSLTRMGAASTFAPPGAMVAHQTAAVAERLGAQPVPGARFEWHAAGTTAQGGRVFRSRPAWLAEATAVGSDGTALIYQFEYEPFAGRLVAVTVQRGR